MPKPTILIENDVFFEDETIKHNSFRVASKYFDAASIPHFLQVEDYFDKTHFIEHDDYPMFWRGSFGMKAQMFRFAQYDENDDKFNCLYWLPALKKYAHNDEYFFLDAEKILNLSDKYWPMFIKPVKGNKAFSGNVFSREQFQTEFTFFTKNLNSSPYIICQCSPENPIDKEYRFVVIDNKVVTGCQYLENAERVDKPCNDVDALALAQIVASNEFFLNFPNFVVDIAETNGMFSLLEVNSIHTSSYYSCDLDLIYSTLAKHYTI